MPKYTIHLSVEVFNEKGARCSKPLIELKIDALTSGRAVIKLEKALQKLCDKETP